MKRILTNGVFDVLHYGHIEYLKKAKAMGDYLIVGLSTDAYIEKRGKKAYYSYEIRKKILEAIKYVDLVIEETDLDDKKDNIVKYKVDILVSSVQYMGWFDYLSDYCEVVYLERTPDISTTQIKKEVNLVDIYKSD